MRANQSPSSLLQNHPHLVENDTHGLEFEHEMVHAKEGTGFANHNSASDDNETVIRRENDDAAFSRPNSQKQQTPRDDKSEDVNNNDHSTTTGTVPVGIDENNLRNDVFRQAFFPSVIANKLNGTVPFPVHKYDASVDPFLNATEEPFGIWNSIKLYGIGIVIIPLRLIFILILMFVVWILATVTMCGVPLHIDEVSCTTIASPTPTPLGPVRKAIGRFIILCIRAWLFLFSFHWISVRGSPDPDAMIFVPNHLSTYESLAVMNKAGCTAVSAAGNARLPMFGNIIRCVQVILVERDSPQSRGDTAAQLKERAKSPKGTWPPTLIYPEGTITNGNQILRFKGGAFSPGVPVQPIIIRHPFCFFDPTWSSTKMGMMALSIRVLSQFHNAMSVEFLPIYRPSEAEIKDANLYAENVRIYMSKASGIPLSPYAADDYFVFAEADKWNMSKQDAHLLGMDGIRKESGFGVTEMKKIIVDFKDCLCFEYDGNAALGRRGLTSSSRTERNGNEQHRAVASSTLAELSPSSLAWVVDDIVDRRFREVLGKTSNVGVERKVSLEEIVHEIEKAKKGRDRDNKNEGNVFAAPATVGKAKEREDNHLKERKRANWTKVKEEAMRNYYKYKKSSLEELALGVVSHGDDHQNKQRTISYPLFLKCFHFGADTALSRSIFLEIIALCPEGGFLSGAATYHHGEDDHTESFLENSAEKSKNVNNPVRNIQSANENKRTLIAQPCVPLTPEGNVIISPFSPLPTGNASSSPTLSSITFRQFACAVIRLRTAYGGKAKDYFDAIVALDKTNGDNDKAGITLKNFTAFMLAAFAPFAAPVSASSSLSPDLSSASISVCAHSLFSFMARVCGGIVAAEKAHTKTPTAEKKSEQTAAVVMPPPPQQQQVENDAVVLDIDKLDENVNDGDVNGAAASPSSPSVFSSSLASPNTRHAAKDLPPPPSSPAMQRADCHSYSKNPIENKEAEEREANARKQTRIKALDLVYNSTHDETVVVLTWIDAETFSRFVALHPMWLAVLEIATAVLTATSNMKQ